MAWQLKASFATTWGLNDLMVCGLSSQCLQPEVFVVALVLDKSMGLKGGLRLWIKEWRVQAIMQIER